MSMIINGLMWLAQHSYAIILDALSINGRHAIPNGPLLGSQSPARVRPRGPRKRQERPRRSCPRVASVTRAEGAAEEILAF